MGGDTEILAVSGMQSTKGKMSKVKSEISPLTKKTASKTVYLNKIGTIYKSKNKPKITTVGAINVHHLSLII